MYVMINVLKFHVHNIGSAITEILQAGHMHVHVPPVEKAWVESGFLAILVLFYEDPENPKLEAMNRVSHVITSCLILIACHKPTQLYMYMYSLPCSIMLRFTGGRATHNH